MENKLPMHRRVKTTMFVLISQGLLLAMAISWVIHMVIVAVNGAAFFVENNPLILWAEITGSVLISAFAVFIFVNQVQRLGERRRADRAIDSRHS